MDKIKQYGECYFRDCNNPGIYEYWERVEFIDITGKTHNYNTFMRKYCSTHFPEQNHTKVQKIRCEPS